MRSNHWAIHWHHISASMRLLIISAVGIITFFLLSPSQALTARLAVSWIIAGSTYLFLSFTMMHSSTEENMLALSKKEDANAVMVLLIIILGAVISLGTIVIILSGERLPSVTDAAWQIGLVLLTYAVSWLLVHTAFTLHYARAYYIELETSKNPPLLFANQLKPIYIDFLYFSMVVGMTCQTADVDIAESKMRFWVMIQGMTAFIFNATLLGIAINLIAGMVAFK